MFSARIAIRLPLSFMNPPSGFARRLGEERAHEGPERPAAALGARSASLVVLADRHRTGHFLLAPLAKVLVDGHGHPPSRQDGLWDDSTERVYAPRSVSTSQRAVRSSRPSPWREPTSWTPSGRPLAPLMSGTLSAGNPHSVHREQNIGSPVDASPAGAMPVAAGVNSASYFCSNSSVKPSLSRGIWASASR